MKSNLYRRIIPKILFSKNHVSGNIDALTTKFYEPYRIMGTPVSQARIFQANIADELILLDVRKGQRDFKDLLEVAMLVGQEIFMPLSVGGGIDSLEKATKLFDIGVEKIVLDSIFLSDKREVEQIAKRFGSQSIIGSCTYWGDFTAPTSSNSSKFLSEPKEVINRVKLMEDLGVGEIIINDASRDGTRRGSNLTTLEQIINSTSLPVIDSCGFGKTRHFLDSFLYGSSAVAIGSYFAYVDQSILQLRNQLSNYGIKVRLK